MTKLNHNNSAVIIKMVNSMLVDAYKKNKKEITFDLENPPVFPVDNENIFPDTETTKKIINRLKIMSKLYPIKFPETAEGLLQLFIGGAHIDIITKFLDTKENQFCWLKLKNGQ